MVSNEKKRRKITYLKVKKNEEEEAIKIRKQHIKREKDSKTYQKAALFYFIIAIIIISIRQPTYIHCTFLSSLWKSAAWNARTHFERQSADVHEMISVEFSYQETDVHITMVKWWYRQAVKQASKWIDRWWWWRTVSKIQ